jgi:RNA polymerase sigma-70 factor, ECF subfamily
MIDDQALLLSYARSRDAEAFAQLATRYSGFVFSIAHRVTGNTATAEDVTQDCFFALAQQAASIRGSLPGWLHGVALKRSRQAIRKDARRQRHEARVLPPSDASGESHWNQISPLVDVALNKLPDELREPLVQHFLLGRTQAQVGANLHINQSTVSRRLQEGIERLREHLRQTGVVCGVAVLSTSLAGNARAAVPARLSASLAKMALAGPGAAAAYTAAATSHGILNTLLVKGALILAALQNAKLAIAIGVGLLLAATTAVVVYENQHYPWQVAGTREMWDQLSQSPPQVKIVPTIFSSAAVNASDGHRYIGIRQRVEDLLQIAYQTSECRMIFESRPEGYFDFIANLPEGNAEALQREIERQLHLTVQVEKRASDVLLLTVKNRHAPGLRPGGTNSASEVQCAVCNTETTVDGKTKSIGFYRGPFHGNGPPLVVFLERALTIPTVDRTNLADSKPIVNLQWDWGAEVWQPGGKCDALKKALLDQLGLVLIPSRETIEVFVVKEKK